MAVKKTITIGALILAALLLLSYGKHSLAKNSETEIASPAFRVTKISLSANPTEYSGPCPKEIKFKAKISATGGKGTVVCQIVRGDNLPAPSITFVFNKAGTKDTTYSWNAEEDFMGWHQLIIVQPNKMESNKVEFSVMCQQ